MRAAAAWRLHGLALTAENSASIQAVKVLSHKSSCAPLIGLTMRKTVIHFTVIYLCRTRGSLVLLITLNPVKLIEISEPTYF